MEFLKNLFKDDETIVGLCGFKNKDVKVFRPQIEEKRPTTQSYYSNMFTQNYNNNYYTNTKNNFLLS